MLKSTITVFIANFHNFTNGCNRDFRKDIDIASGHEKYAVRCCDISKPTCISPNNPCQVSKTYPEAENICSEKELNLCPRNDALDSVCCKTGCNLDNKPMWIADDSKGKM